MIKLARIFQDGMVLQRDKRLRIWGSTDGGTVISCAIQNRKSSAAADENGSFCLTLEPLCASNAEQLHLWTEKEELVLSDVAVGEVWIAAGQSNMEFYMRYEKHLGDELTVCENGRLRFFDMPEVCYPGQEEDFDYARMGFWRKADAKNLEYFSAVGYYFAKQVIECLDVPVGIVGCSWGGTTSSVWMSEKSVKKAGPLWYRDYIEKTQQMDWEEYWKKQHTSALNDRGNPFADPFSELVLKETVSQEKFEEFLSGQPQGFSDYFTELMPSMIPGCLYEHMVKPLAPYGVRGVLWYQGESDDVDGRQSCYADMLGALIADWRALWAEPLPFLVVQLPGWERWLASECGDYAAIRECQRRVADGTASVYLCSIADAGEQYDIHPKNKKVVGERLALLARGHVYGEDVLCDAPRPDACERRKRELRIHF